MQWLSHKEKRSIFGGYYTVWTKYYERIFGDLGNDTIIFRSGDFSEKQIEKIIANENFENILCTPRLKLMNHH